jgi:hypothetical protein
VKGKLPQLLRSRKSRSVKEKSPPPPYHEVASRSQSKNNWFWYFFALLPWAIPTIGQCLIFRFSNFLISQPQNFHPPTSYNTNIVYYCIHCCAITQLHHALCRSFRLQRFYYNVKSRTYAYSYHCQ